MTFYTLDEICKSFVDFNGNIDDIFRRIYVDDIPTTYFVTCDGRVFNKYDNLYREIKGVEIKKGYLIVLIYYNEKSGKRTRKRFYVHRLVAKAFIPIPENYIRDGYTEKTKRKTEYYSSLDDIIFIGIYPDDIKDNFKGVKDKFDTLLL